MYICIYMYMCVLYVCVRWELGVVGYERKRRCVGVGVAWILGCARPDVESS